MPELNRNYKTTGPPLDCSAFETDLNRLLDDRQPLELDAALAEHAASCRPCRALFSAYDDVLRTVASAPLVAPPDGLVARVLRGLSDGEASLSLPTGRASEPSAMPREPAAPATTSRRNSKSVTAWRMAFASSAAALLVAVGLAWWFASGSTFFGGGGQDIANQADNQGAADPNTAVPPAGGATTPAVATLARQAADCYAELAHEAGKDLTDVMALVPDLSQTAVARVLPPASGTTEAAGNVASGLQPLADSTAGAVGFLMDVLPGGREL